MHEVPQTIEVRGRTLYLYEAYTHKSVAEKVSISLRKALYLTHIRVRRGANAVYTLPRVKS